MGFYQALKLTHSRLDSPIIAPEFAPITILYAEHIVSAAMLRVRLCMHLVTKVNSLAPVTEGAFLLLWLKNTFK